MHRRLSPFIGRLGVDVGFGEKDFDHAEVPLFHRQMQGVVKILVFGVDVDPLVYQNWIEPCGQTGW